MNITQQGVTLVELLITIAVMSILVTIAAPSLNNMLENNRLLVLNNRIVSALVYTRSEAIKQKYDTSMCVRNSNGTDCADTGGFEQGWIIFVDCDGNKKVTTADACDYLDNATNLPGADNIPDTPETILVDSKPSSEGITITTTGSIGRIVTYQPRGNKQGVSGSFSINSNHAGQQRISITAATGRIRSCKVPEGKTTC